MNNSFIYKTIHRLIYTITAKGAFSIHSPFVFDLFIHVIKRKNPIKGSKKMQLIGNFSCISEKFCVKILPLNGDISTVIKEICIPYSVVILEDIHCNKKKYKQWKECIVLKEKFISIDLFFIGVLISNPQILRKQHYILKNH